MDVAVIGSSFLSIEISYVALHMCSVPSSYKANQGYFFQEPLQSTVMLVSHHQGPLILKWIRVWAFTPCYDHSLPSPKHTSNLSCLMSYNPMVGQHCQLGPLMPLVSIEVSPEDVCTLSIIWLVDMACVHECVCECRGEIPHISNQAITTWSLATYTIFCKHLESRSQ